MSSSSSVKCRKAPLTFTLKDVLKKREILETKSFSEAECKNIADASDVLKIHYLKVDIKLSPIAKNKGVVLFLHIKSQLEQSCVVTLASVTQNMNEKILLRFFDQDEEAPIDLRDGAVFLEEDFDFSDTDTLPSEGIDVLSLIEEHFILGIDPLPRVKNAAFTGYTLGDIAPEQKAFVEKNLERIDKGEVPLSAQNPFAILAELKK